MTANALGAVMDAIGTALAGVSGLRVFDFPPLNAVPPFAYVNMPDTIEYDLTYGRATDRFTLDVVVGVGAAEPRNRRDQLAAYAVGTSVKAAIEGIVLAGASFHVVRASFATITLDGGAYPGVVFTVDVAA